MPRVISGTFDAPAGASKLTSFYHAVEWVVSEEGRPGLITFHPRLFVCVAKRVELEIVMMMVGYNSRMISSITFHTLHQVEIVTWRLGGKGEVIKWKRISATLGEGGWGLIFQHILRKQSEMMKVSWCVCCWLTKDDDLWCEVWVFTRHVNWMGCKKGWHLTRFEKQVLRVMCSNIF